MKLGLFVWALLLATFCSAQDSLDVAYVKTKNSKWQIIDRSGKVLADSLFENEFAAILNCNEGMAITEQGARFGFRNILNNHKIENRFDTVTAFKNGNAAVKLPDGWHLLDRSGSVNSKLLSQEGLKAYLQPMISPSTCKDNYCLIENDTFINCKGPDGKLLLAKSDVFVAPWNDVNSFINDRILKYKVMANKICSCHKMTSYYGFIDRNNNWVIEPDFEQADIFSCGLASVGVGFEDVYTYGYIGMNGDWAIKPVYKEAGRFMKIPVSK